MKTAHAVADDGIVSNELLGQVHRKVDEIVRRMKTKNLSSSWVLRELQSIVEGPRWDVWKRSVIGQGRFHSIKDFVDAFEAKGMTISSSIDRIPDVVMGKHLFLEATSKKVANLVALTPADLGLVGHGPGEHFFFFGEVIRRAKEWGLEFCPLEAGLFAILELEDVEKEEEWLIASEPFMSEENEPLQIFCSRMSGIGSAGFFPKSEVDGDMRFVFCKGYHPYMSTEEMRKRLRIKD